MILSQLRIIVKWVAAQGSGYGSGVLVVNRFRVPESEGEAFARDLQAALELLAACPGHLTAQIGRNVDDPALWVLTTTWENVGAYRRALSSYDVRVGAWPVLARAIEEPSAFELLQPGSDLAELDRRGTDSTRSLG